MTATEEPKTVENEPIAVGTQVIIPAANSFRQRYLYAFATQAEVLNQVRTQAIKEESDRIREILPAWVGLQTKVEALLKAEEGLAETVKLVDVPREHLPAVEKIVNNESFQRTFSQLPSTVGIVETDYLVAPQRTVNLDYVDRLVKSYPRNPMLDELIGICLSSKRLMDPLRHLELGPNTHVFSSPNSDVRFLGAYAKELSEDDLKYAENGGIPVAAVIAFIGYGGAPVNVLKVGNRIILNNGFHRVYALRSMGISSIPVVVQHVTNPQLEVPPVVGGLPKEYLLGSPRPVMMKDFFIDEFGTTLRIKERVKMVTLGIALNQHEVPS